MAPVVRIALLGKLRFVAGEKTLDFAGTHRLQSLLAYLVLHSGAQSRERLAPLLWPESSESQARTNLRQLLHHLRRALPAECALLATDNQTAVWRRDAGCSVDVFEFESAAARAARAEKQGEPEAAREALEQAARLYGDDLLPDLYDEWLRDRRERLREMHADVLGRLAAALGEAGEHAAAIRHATRLIAVDPLRETSYQLLMRLHARNGDRSNALRVYHQCMRTLKRELGIAPAKATQDLFVQALKAEESAPAPQTEAPTSAATAPLPMVGRREERQTLLECWGRAGAGETQFALILGEPGVGKSRLAEDVFRHCLQGGAGAAARARCYFAQGRIAYGPVAEWLRAEALERARSGLRRAQLAELARVLPEILAEHPEIPAPPPLTESWQRRHLYEAANAVLEKSPKPLLLFVDDLQWCDGDTLEWLHSFLRSGAAAGTLVMGTARAEEVGREHPLAALALEMRRSAGVREVPLAPLSAEEAGALAAEVAGRECDEAFAARIYQATKGNPLFVVESVRASLEGGGARSGAASARVQAVIGERLAQLPAAAYELAGLAATIGRPFSFELLAKATDWDEASLSRALEELWQRKIIDGQGAGSYDYTHDLLREVAYGELSPIRRRWWHARVARALEELHAADLEGVSAWLAAHHEAAGAAERAMSWYRAAADAAKRRFADAESAEQIERALRLCRGFPESAGRDRREIDLLAMLGPSLVTTRGYSRREVGETYERGLELMRRSGDRKQAFSLLSGAWLFHMVRGNLEQARRLGRECNDLGRVERSGPVEMAGSFLLGSTLFHMGRLRESAEQIERATALGGGRCDPALALFAGPDLGVFCRAYLSHLQWLFGEAGEAAARSEESMALARELGHPFSLAIALDYAAMLSVLGGDAEQALERAEESAALCRRYDFAYYLAWADMLAGWALASQGGAEAGIARLRGGLEAFRAMGAELRLPFYYGLLAEACGFAERRGEALASVSSGLAFQSKNADAWWAPELHRVHGDLLRADGNAAEAEKSYRRAMAEARESGARMLEERARARLAEPGPARARARKAPQR